MADRKLPDDVTGAMAVLTASEVAQGAEQATMDLERALVLVRSLVDPVLGRNLGLDPVLGHNLGLDPDPVLGHNLGLDPAVALARSLDRDRVSALALAVANDRDLDRSLSRGLALGLAQALDGEVEVDLGLALGLARRGADHTSGIDLARARHRASDWVLADLAGQELPDEVLKEVRRSGTDVGVFYFWLLMLALARWIAAAWAVSVPTDEDKPAGRDAAVRRGQIDEVGHAELGADTEQMMAALEGLLSDETLDDDIAREAEALRTQLSGWVRGARRSPVSFGVMLDDYGAILRGQLLQRGNAENDAPPAQGLQTSTSELIGAGEAFNSDDDSEVVQQVNEEVAGAVEATIVNWMEVVADHEPELAAEANWPEDATLDYTAIGAPDGETQEHGADPPAPVPPVPGAVGHVVDTTLRKAETWVERWESLADLVKRFIKVFPRKARIAALVTSIGGPAGMLLEPYIRTMIDFLRHAFA